MSLGTGDRPRNVEGLLCDGEVYTATRLDDAANDDGLLVVFYGYSFSAIAENWWRGYERRAWDEFDVPVVGVSRDGPNAQNAFIRSLDSPFSLFADVNGALADEFDVLVRRDHMAGVQIPRRSAFLLEPDLTVERAWTVEDWTKPMPVSDIEDAVR